VLYTIEGEKMKKMIFGLLVASLSPLLLAANQMEEHAVQPALSTEEARTKLGSKVKFFFAEKPANLNGQVVAVSKVRRKTSRGHEEPCNRALLSSLLWLKKEAEKRGSHYVVNIVSNYDNNVVARKETFQCAVGLWAVEVALKGEIMEPNTTLIDDAYMSQPVQPLDESPAILIQEPVIIKSAPSAPSVRQPEQPVAAPAQVEAPRAVSAEAQERLRVLKQLYEAGEIDRANYDVQKQRIMNGQ
jgi:hypothetical protein